MGQAIDKLRARLNAYDWGHCEYFIVSRAEMADAIGEADDLQARHATQAETIRDQLDRKRRADALIAAQAQKIQDLCDVLARKSFEVQVLEMTQGALKMEIDRLRDRPTIEAEDATVTISHDGITLSAPMITLSGGAAEEVELVACSA